MADSAIITMDLTRAGFELYGKINAELTPLHITRVVIGDGYLAEGETIYDLAAVKHEVSNVTVQIVSVENLGDGRSRMLIRITGQNKDFYLREIAVMAEDPDNGEIMYSGCNYGDMADYVMTYAGAAPVMQEGNIYFITGTGDLTVEVSHDNASVTHAEFEAHTNDKENPHNVTAEQLFENATALKTITNEKLIGYAGAVSEKHTHENKGILDTITQAVINKWNSAVNHITNRENPHGVTKAQVGLGNVPNVSTNDQKPTFTEAETRTNIESGETLSTILGKIKKWFSSLKSVAFSGSYNDLNDKPTLFSGKYSDLSGVPSSFAPSTHYHNWNAIQNKPSSFTPSAHTHSISDISGLSQRLSDIESAIFNSFSSVYAAYYFGNYQTISSLSEYDASYYSYQQSGYNNSGVKKITNTSLMPSYSDNPVFFLSYDNSNDDQIEIVQQMLYSNGKVYERTKLLWWYDGGARTNAVWSDWYESSNTFNPR